MPAYPPVPERMLWTFDQLEQLPEDGNRYEILHGELLVTPMPTSRHQRVAARLLLAVATWCRAHTGWTFLAPGGVYISDTNWLEPDVAVYPTPEYDNRSWRELPPPVFIAEILSPSTGSRDRHSKRAAYLANGVADVWTVDPDARTIECWTSTSEFPIICRDFAVWVPDESLPAMIVTTDELFGPPIG